MYLHYALSGDYKDYILFLASKINSLAERNAFKSIDENLLVNLLLETIEEAVNRLKLDKRVMLSILDGANLPKEVLEKIKKKVAEYESKELREKDEKNFFTK